ncbi:hypothetical protein GCM10009759_55480 [Kitasatospora saccharophila]|uniref:Holliday junction resolvasome RuvABC endonuclease subunit n=1 Tax=Kitasatospora saccharophila TaxID=407973 RepID=A0ABN2XHP0_9ACTN
MSQLLLPTVVPAPAGAAPAPAPAAAGARPLVIGLDLSLTCTGIAGHGWSEHVRGGTRRGEERLGYILGELQSFYRAADFVAIEGESFASKHRHDEMISLFWLVRLDLWKRGIPIAVIKPAKRVVYVLGNGQPCDPATGHRLTGDPLKAAVRDAASALFGVEFEGPGKFDRADAYVVFAMAMHHLGHPLAELPATHTRALDGVAWPERTDQ